MSHPAPRYVRSPSAPFLGSLSVDRRLAVFDIAGSIAHAEMLGAVGLLSSEEVGALTSGLRRIGAEVRDGRFPWREELEDVHTNVEVRLTELIGPTGGKLHTARSRNDQVALDERLYLRASVSGLAHRILDLEEALLARAREETDTLLPGYTHLQRAQPVTLAHHLLAHLWRLDRDFDRLLATARRANVSPLGAGALAGSTLPIDPERVARRLGFERAFENSLDAVSDRDPFVELAFDLALLAIHLSAIGEEIVLWATSEFGFVRPSPVLGSGSSLMPQKHNPDVAELARAKSGRAVGNLVSLLTTLKGLPLAYDRDLQEDKAPVLDAVASAEATLDALYAVVRAIDFDRARMASAARDPALRATDIAERMVADGVPFRAAHEAVAAHFSGETSGPVPEVDPADPLAHRDSPGGPSPASVRRQIARATERLSSAAQSLSSLDRSVGLIEELVKEEPK